MRESALPDAAAAGAPGEQTGAPGAQAGAPVPGGVTSAGTNWFYYCLGLALQTFLWLLLFLGIIVAVVVGTHLTEFRYVGF